MQLSVATAAEITQYYTTTVESLSEIATSYFALGRIRDAQHVLRMSLELISVGEAEPQERLKLLLLSVRVDIAASLLARADMALLIVTIKQVQQLAEEYASQLGIAQALSLLGQAHYFAAILRGALVASPQSGVYDQAFTYLQEALERLEALQDTAGICEAHFYLANVYDRWQDYEQAQQQYQQAREIAEQYGHLFIQAELARHRAVPAFFQGDLDLALTNALQALSLREATPFRPYLPLDHLLLRDMYRERGDLEQANIHTAIASSLASEIGYPEYVASAPDMGALKAQRADMFFPAPVKD